ncbi:hypothetical protein PVAND_002069 [Polypedilum vanderplanki]|uniref:Osiris 7 n=1 Tax=Polypedilum vanderplanki TaxID=319348 RepID=A0A9J6BPV8_POLVA|nr:hypothetical protein PVAND_002069 [Polypedilum vanderplanki]
MNPKVIGLVCIFLVTVTALPAEETRGHSRNAVGSDNDLMDSIYTDCLRKDSVNCVKYKLVSFVDKMVGARDTFALTEGVTVIKVPGAEQGEGAPRAINGDESIESLVFSRIQNFLQSHTIKVELKGSDIVSAVSSTGRALEDVSESIYGDDGEGKVEARDKKKKAAKMLGPLMMALALKAAALLPLVLGAIALIAGKALLIGKIALVLSAIIGLKKLLSQEKHVTYEVLAHPHHTSSHTSSHSDSFAGGFSGGDSGSYGAAGASSGGHGWGRSYDAQDLAYKGQKA